MAAVKSVARALLLSAVLAQAARADAISLASWTSWDPFGGTSAASRAAAAQAAPAAALSAPPTPSGPVDAFINLGVGPYPDAGTLTTGGAQPWYAGAGVANIFGGTPNAQQQADFASTVFQRVEQTFQLSGVPVTLTTDPNVAAAHTLSVVSSTANGSIPNAIGMTYVGGNGFDFVDQVAKSVSTVDQLEWVVAHNIAHELMLAFGVGENYDQSGKYIDARNASWAMMTSPNATFSQSASQALLSANFLTSIGTVQNAGAQLAGPQTIPEPATVALWGLAATALAFWRRRWARGTTA
jgi:hypothetical protein